MTLRVVFAGTPEFAVPSLSRIFHHPAFELVWVYTQPDRRSGRGMKVQYSAVKKWCIEHEVRCLQPEKVGAQEADALRCAKIDVLVVAAYGQILPVGVLDAVGGRAINLHGSVLPRWRGASPVSAAIFAGDAFSGYSIMQMEKGLDSGPVYLSTQIPTGGHSCGTLTEKIAQEGAKGLCEVLEKLDRIVPTPQPDDGITYAPKISKEAARIDWDQTVEDILRHLRAYNPHPVAYWVFSEVRIKVYAACESTHPFPAKPPGSVVAYDHAGLHMAARDGVVCVTELQLPGKKPMRLEGQHFPLFLCK